MMRIKDYQKEISSLNNLLEQFREELKETRIDLNSQKQLRLLEQNGYNAEIKKFIDQLNKKDKSITDLKEVIQYFILRMTI